VVLTELALAPPKLKAGCDPPPWAAFTSAVVNDGPVRQVAAVLWPCKIIAVNGPRVSVSSGCQSDAVVLGAAADSRVVQSSRAVAVWPLAGRVGVAFQPARAFGALVPAKTMTRTPATAPATASAPMPPRARRRDQRGRFRAATRLLPLLAPAGTRSRTSSQSGSSGVERKLRSRSSSCEVAQEDDQASPRGELAKCLSQRRVVLMLGDGGLCDEFDKGQPAPVAPGLERHPNSDSPDPGRERSLASELFLVTQRLRERFLHDIARQLLTPR